MTYVRQQRGKIKPVTASSLDRLIEFADADGCESNHERALWLIDHVDVYRSKGYQVIMEMLNAGEAKL